MVLGAEARGSDRREAVTLAVMICVWLVGIAAACVWYIRSQSEDMPVGAFVVAIMLWPLAVLFAIVVGLLAKTMRRPS